MEPTPVVAPAPVLETPIVETPVEAGPTAPDAGVPHETIVTNPNGEQEKIIYEADEHGTVIGWHKEVVGG